jgi:hypothetical protein
MEMEDIQNLIEFYISSKVFTDETKYMLITNLLCR